MVVPPSHCKTWMFLLHTMVVVMRARDLLIAPVGPVGVGSPFRGGRGPGGCGGRGLSESSTL